MNRLFQAALPAAANAFWWLLCWPESLAFRRDVKRVAMAQERLLLRLLARNAGTDYGRKYGFGA
ncbi:MAG: hypothetical protein ABI977_21850, partial [Acidobacteriota bacterium]